MSSHATLEAAAQDRKARLAQLKSLKRKQPSSGADLSSDEPTSALEETSSEPSVTTIYLSGRNFDAETRGPRLGFEVNPAEDQDTLERRAEELAQQVKAQAEKEAEDKPLDLFSLQPKKPNWDLKRDLEEKLRTVNVRTENAIARLVRERVLNQAEEKRKRLQEQGGGRVDGDGGEEVGMEGVAFVEAMHVREREEEEERERERRDDEMGVV